MRILKRGGEKPWVIGEVIRQRRGKGRVEYLSRVQILKW